MNAREWLDVVEARANAATEGPWESGHEWHKPGCEVFQVSAETDDGLFSQVADTKFWPAYQDGGDRLAVACANSHFIAHARTDVPALVAALRAVLDLADAADASQLAAMEDYSRWVSGEAVPDTPPQVVKVTPHSVRATIDTHLGGAS